MNKQSPVLFKISIPFRHKFNESFIIVLYFIFLLWMGMKLIEAQMKSVDVLCGIAFCFLSTFFLNRILEDNFSTLLVTEDKLIFKTWHSTKSLQLGEISSCYKQTVGGPKFPRDIFTFESADPYKWNIVIPYGLVSDQLDFLKWLSKRYELRL